MLDAQNREAILYLVQEFPEARPEINLTEIKSVYSLCHCLNLILCGCRSIENQDIFSLDTAEASWKKTTLPP